MSEETAQTCVGLTDTPWGLVYCLALEIKSSQKLIQAVKLSIEKISMDFRQKYILIIQNIYLLLSMNIFGTLSIRTLFEKIFPNENLVKYDPTNVARTK